MEKEIIKSEALALINSKLKIKDLREMSEFTHDEYGRIFFGVSGDTIKFWEDNDYSLLDLTPEDVQHFCDVVITAHHVLLKHPGFDGDMMLGKLGILDGFHD